MMTWRPAAGLAMSIVVVGLGCRDTSTAVAVVPGAPAGDVVEVAGTVTATRAGATRRLAVGDVVAGDDVLHTGDDGRVVIVLRHNEAIWGLGPSKERTVGESLAWRAARGAVSDEGVGGDLHSAAAGRHAERVAGETSAVRGAAPDLPRADSKREATSKPALEPKTLDQGAPDDPMPKAGRVAITEVGGDVTIAGSPDAVVAAVRDHAGELATCRAPDADAGTTTLSVVLAIAADGTVTTASLASADGGVADPVASCVLAQARAWKLPAGPAAITATIDVGL